MSAFEWAMLSITVAGFALNLCLVIVGGVKGIEAIKADTAAKINAEILARTEEINKAKLEVAKALSNAVEARSKEMDGLRSHFEDGQKQQDHNFGEMGSALRRFIESVEKEMHKIEIWGRDNYVQKSDFERAIDQLSKSMNAGIADLKGDVKQIGEKFDRWIQGRVQGDVRKS